jgi:Domain of unknown function (DUF397)
MEQLNELSWRKSSYSGGNGGACIQVARHGGKILVRDTKDHGRGPVQQYAPAAWRAFIAALREH